MIDCTRAPNLHTWPVEVHKALVGTLLCLHSPPTTVHLACLNGSQAADEEAHEARISHNGVYPEVSQHCQLSGSFLQG